MANARQLYMQAESKGRLLSGRLQQRLQDSTAHDEHRANVEIHYRLVHSRESPELGEQLQNPHSYEKIALEGGWNLVTVFSNGSHNPAYSNYLSPTEGSICCLANDKMKDVNESEDRLEWSEVIFQFP